MFIQFLLSFANLTNAVPVLRPEPLGLFWTNIPVTGMGSFYFKEFPFQWQAFLSEESRITSTSCKDLKSGINMQKEYDTSFNSVHINFHCCC